jgi:hypothetical protein
MAKAKGKPRRPILAKSVIVSLDVLACSTPATDETERALRYIRALVAYETSPERVKEKARLSAIVQAAKRKA